MAQIYENYWKYTAAFTDLNGVEFINVLRACVNYYDKHDITKISYEDLQGAVDIVHPMDGPSIRKAINQLVKLGFLIPKMGGYHREALDYLKATNDNQRKNALSKLVYKSLMANATTLFASYITEYFITTSFLSFITALLKKLVFVQNGVTVKT